MLSLPILVIVACNVISREIHFSSCHKHGTKEKFWVPTRNQTSHLWIPRSNALWLSHRDSMVSKSQYKVHIWHASCILLRSAMSIVSCFANRIRKTVSFKHGIYFCFNLAISLKWYLPKVSKIFIISWETLSGGFKWKWL